MGIDFTNSLVYDLEMDFVSGSELGTSVSFELQSIEGQSILTDNTSYAIVNSISSDVQVQKEKTVTAVNGVFTFNDLLVIGEPGSSILLEVQTAAVDSSIIEKAYGFTPQKIYLLAYLRICISGEYQSSDGKCITCPDGFYTLSENQN